MGITKYLILAIASVPRFCLVVLEANSKEVCDLVGGSGYPVCIILDI